MDLVTQATSSYTDIWAIYAQINRTGTLTYGTAVANIASIVNSAVPGVHGGSLVTAWNKVHLWTGTGGGLPTAAGVTVSIDLFDANYSASNGNSEPAHAYGVSGAQTAAFFATGDHCIGAFQQITDCLNQYAPAFPCAFANVDLTGTPFSLVNDFQVNSLALGSGVAGTVVFDTVYNKTASIFGGAYASVNA